MNVNIPPHPTRPHDQHNIISVTWTWTLTSHPTPPHPTPSSNKNRNMQTKKQKKTTKHPGALQRPWLRVCTYTAIFILTCTLGLHLISFLAVAGSLTKSWWAGGPVSHLRVNHDTNVRSSVFFHEAETICHILWVIHFLARSIPSDSEVWHARAQEIRSFTAWVALKPKVMPNRRGKDQQLTNLRVK